MKQHTKKLIAHYLLAGSVFASSISVAVAEPSCMEHLGVNGPELICHDQPGLSNSKSDSTFGWAIGAAAAAAATCWLFDCLGGDENEPASRDSGDDENQGRAWEDETRERQAEIDAQAAKQREAEAERTPAPAPTTPNVFGPGYTTPAW